MKILALTLGALALSACSVNGKIYSQKPTEEGKTQLVIYHPSGELIGSIPLGSGPDVKVNGQTVCGLPNSSYFIYEVEPGSVTVSSTKALAIGTSSVSFKSQPDKRYYVRITWDSDKVWAGAAGGLIGEAISEGVSSNSGPFAITLIDENVAKNELAALKRGPC